MIKIKRVYESAENGDGTRILVDRLWPRGVSKSAARIDGWLKEIAPSNELRKWFAHDIKRWERFKTKYSRELEQKMHLIDELRSLSKRGTVTIVYSAKDELHNQAVVLKEILERREIWRGRLSHPRHR